MTKTARPMMDRRLKERLVGASILVALIVAIVPELLSGPTRPAAAPPAAVFTAPTRTVVVDITKHKAVGSGVTEPQGAAAPAAAPGSTDAGGGVPARAATSPQPAAGAGASPPLESASPSPKSSSKSGPAGSAWAVQLGSFATKANAEKLVRQLKSSGISVYLISTGSGSSLRYRVRMGPMADRKAAEREADKLKAEGHAATVVNPTA